MHKIPSYAYIIALIVVAVAVFALFPLERPLTIAPSASAKVYYPLYSSICCEAIGSHAWVSAGGMEFSTHRRTYVCPMGTTQCRVRNPQVTCPGASLVAPLGYSRAWAIRMTNPTTGITDDYSNLPFTPTLPHDGVTFHVGDTLEYTGGCINNLVFVNPTNFMVLINLISKGVPPTTGTLNVDIINTQLYIYSALESKQHIPNTQLCQMNADTQSRLNLEKSVNPTLLNRARTAASNIFNINVAAPSGGTGTSYAGELKNAPMRQPGDCYSFLDKFIELPGYGNINPLGTYQGKNVICSLTKGVVEVQQISPNIYVPTTRLTQPSDFCCNQEYCKQKYNDPAYHCVDYSCKKQEGYCRSDLDCRPMGGVLEDLNCYRDQATGKFFSWSSFCQSNNLCSKPVTKEVMCCPNTCPPGMWCNPDKGCQPTIAPSQPCPPGKCCQTNNQYNYLVRTCPSGLKCCDVTLGVGTCKESCEDQDNPCGNCFAWLWDKVQDGEYCEPKPSDKILWFIPLPMTSQDETCPIYLTIYGAILAIALALVYVIISKRGKK